jgi:hypothetical protein
MHRGEPKAYFQIYKIELSTQKIPISYKNCIKA